MLLIYEAKIKNFTIKNDRATTHGNGYKLDIDLVLKKLTIDDKFQFSKTIENYLNKNLESNHIDSANLSVYENSEDYDVQICKSYTYISIGVYKDKFFDIYRMLTTEDKKINYLYLEFNEEDFKDYDNLIDDFSYILKNGDKFQFIKDYS
jgi:hypothetical protein